MKVVLNLKNTDRVAPLDLDADCKGETLKALAEAQFNIPSARLLLTFNGRSLSNQQTLRQSGIKENDIILVSSIGNAQGNLSLDQIPQEIWNNPAALQEFVQAHPPLLQQLLVSDPTLAEAILAPDPSFLQSLFQQRMSEARQRERTEQLRVMQLNADPFDIEAQKRIEEEIRMKNVTDNMEKAIEYNPESFGRVVMLYVPCRVNGVESVAFVDSGAQSTIMSASCAERCGLLRLLDTRFAGVAKGVGTAKILGRVHAAHVKMGSAHFQSSITIMESQDMDFLFGLDQLKRHQASIDLKDNCLRIHGQSIPFLSEKDLPQHIRKEDSGGDESKQPSSSLSSGSGLQTQPRPTTTAQPRPSPGPSPSPPTSASPPVSRPAAPVATSAHSPAPGPAAAGVPSQPRGAAPAPGDAAAAALGHLLSGLQARPQFPEDKIQRITALGFTRQQVLEALAVCGGNEDMAASLLFQQQLGGF